VCLIIAGWQAHPDYPLVVAANRDEFVNRPAVPAHWWPDAPHLLAGRDLEAGGTWLGISRSGRFSALTNFRDPSQRASGLPSRGALVRAALEASSGPRETLDNIARNSADYAGFNLLVSDGAQFGIHESTTGTVRLLAPGVYGLSNHVLDTEWPKLKRAREAFSAALHTLPDSRAFLTLLRDTTPVADDQLPDTGVSLEWERRLSTAFIDSPTYGTRCSTLLTVDRSGEVRFTEWTWLPGARQHSMVTHRFGVDASRGEQSPRP
jgi:uncharacterized protein with NRDE domain